MMTIKLAAMIRTTMLTTLIRRQPREVGGIKSKNWCCWILGMFWRLLARSSGGGGTMRMMSITILIVQVAIKIYYCRGGSGKQRESEIDRQASGASSIRFVVIAAGSCKTRPNNAAISVKSEQFCIQ